MAFHDLGGRDHLTPFNMLFSSNKFMQKYQTKHYVFSEILPLVSDTKAQIL